MQEMYYRSRFLSFLYSFKISSKTHPQNKYQQHLMMNTPVKSDRWPLIVAAFSGRKMKTLKQKNEAIAMIESSKLLK